MFKRMLVPLDGSKLAEVVFTYAKELAGTRDTLAYLQAQVAQGQLEVAAQRDELLQRLGGARQIPVTARSENHQPEIQEEPSPASAPKPAASRAAEQFRKLRRDAKRKAIGA